MKILTAAAVSAAAAAILLGASVGPALATSAATATSAASATGIYKNCDALHGKYKHGVGRSDARDHTSGKPVTSFTHSTSAYNAAVKANKSLDRDKDGIACESA